jgi:hypothetical protein
MGIWEWNALHVSTAYRKPLVTEKLVKAGADPTLRDALGLSPLDYAIRDTRVWEKMGDARMHYTPIEQQSRLRILRRIARNCIQNILVQSQSVEAKREFERINRLGLLA